MNCSLSVVLSGSCSQGPDPYPPPRCYTRAPHTFCSVLGRLLTPSLIILLLFYFFEFQYFIHKSLMVCTRAAIFVPICFSFLFTYFIFYHVTWHHMSQIVTWLSLSLDTKFSHGFPMVSPCFTFVSHSYHILMDMKQPRQAQIGLVLDHSALSI